MSGTPDLGAPEALARRAVAGDLDSLRAVLAAYLPELAVYIRLHAGPDVLARESVSDLTQSVAADVLPALQGQHFPDLGGFLAYVRQAALHKIIDKQRHHRAGRRDVRREADASPSLAEDAALAQGLRDLATPSGHAMAREDAALLARALARLPEDQRQVVTLARLLGMPHAAIAGMLGRSEGACRMLLRRGMLALARELEAEERGADR